MFTVEMNGVDNSFDGSLEAHEYFYSQCHRGETVWLYLGDDCLLCYNPEDKRVNLRDGSQYIYQTHLEYMNAYRWSFAIKS